MAIHITPTSVVNAIGTRQPGTESYPAAQPCARIQQQRPTKEHTVMPKPPLPQHVIEMLSRPNPAVIATLRGDGSPVTVATWYAWDDGRILVNMDAERRRLAYMKADPRVSLTALDSDNWYTHVSVQGRVARFENDIDHEGIDRLSLLYTGKPYPDRVRRRVNAWIEIETWFAWGEAG
jgi:PPOX class probable F420-dependent enzyme